MLTGVSIILMIAGGVGLAGSVLWWHAFFTEVARVVGATGGLPVECIYTIGGQCAMVTRIASTLGASAYDPRLFWAALGVVITGVILWLLPHSSKPSEFAPRTASRRDPFL